jgi:hypothetical protein
MTERETPLTKEQIELMCEAPIGLDRNWSRVNAELLRDMALASQLEGSARQLTNVQAGVRFVSSSAPKQEACDQTPQPSSAGPASDGGTLAAWVDELLRRLDTNAAFANEELADCIRRLRAATERRARAGGREKTNG